MRYSMLIAKKEIKSFFDSPAGYITLAFFLILTGWFFASPLFLIGQADLRTMFNVVPIIYIFFIPAITMGLISKEKSSGTYETLATFPINDSEIVMGKFLASAGIIAIGLLFTFVHLITILILGKNVDFGQFISGYFGLLLLGSVYSAIGIFGSSLSKNQIVSFLISLIIVIFFYLIQQLVIFLPQFLSGFFQYISTGYHFSNLSRGVIDTRDLIYFFSLIYGFLFLSTKIMESRKW